VAAVFFYLFSAVLIASAFAVISARNPVHSVLFLILAFATAPVFSCCRARSSWR